MDHILITTVNIVAIKKIVVCFVFFSINVGSEVGIKTYLNNDGSLEGITSTAIQEFASNDKESIREAFKMAKMNAISNLTNYMDESVSSSENLHSTSDQNKDIQTYTFKFKSSSKAHIKGLRVINQTINKKEKYVSITISISPKNVQIADKISTVINEPQKNSKNNEFNEYLKSIDTSTSNGVFIKKFNNNYYVVSLVSKKLTNLLPRTKISTMKLTKILALNNLKKFSHGSSVDYLSTLKGTVITTNYENGISEKSSENLEEKIQVISAHISKGNSVKYLWHIKYGTLFHYAYIKIPK